MSVEESDDGRRALGGPSLLAVVAHELLNSVTAIHGLLTSIRDELDDDASDLSEMLRSAEARARSMADVLHSIVRGHPHRRTTRRDD